jgi:hypothetical protein
MVAGVAEGSGRRRDTSAVLCTPAVVIPVSTGERAPLFLVSHVGGHLLHDGLGNGF